MVTKFRSQTAVAVFALMAFGPQGFAAPLAPAWLGEDLPLPLKVKTPQEILFKTEAERQYLVFNLMAGGKYAFDAGDYGEAAKKWETLLKLPRLAPEVRAVVQPLLTEAREAASADLGVGTRPNRETAAVSVTREAVASSVASAVQAAPDRVEVSGTVSGGGALGPDGAVLWLKRIDGPTLTTRPGRRRVIKQRNKTFSPRILAVTVGTTVDFRNDDDFYHNVFSLTPGADFDTGLYPSGRAYARTFTKPGPVELLCNIHATMGGHVFVVDSPHYTQPRANGSFVIRGVPPGRYELSVWHEASSSVSKQTLLVRAPGLRGVNIKIGSDKPPILAVPDKYGKPRHLQLGY